MQKNLTEANYRKAVIYNCGNCEHLKGLIDIKDCVNVCKGVDLEHIDEWNFCSLFEQIVDDEFVCNKHVYEEKD